MIPIEVLQECLDEATHEWLKGGLVSVNEFSGNITRDSYKLMIRINTMRLRCGLLPIPVPDYLLPEQDNV